MSELQYLQDRKCYLIKDAVLDGKKGLEATFHGSLDTSKADIYLDVPDGDYIGTLMLSNGKGENTSYQQVQDDFLMLDEKFFELVHFAPPGLFGIPSVYSSFTERISSPYSTQSPSSSFLNRNTVAAGASARSF